MAEIYNYDSTLVSDTSDNDYIENDASQVLFVYSGGNDTISGFDSTSTLKIASGTLNPTINADDKNLILSVGSNKITLMGSTSDDYYETVDTVDKPNIVDANGNPIDYKIHLVGAGNIQNTRNNIVIDAYTGIDIILNGGMEGEDYEGYYVITGGGDSVVVNGDAGNDLIRNFGNATTLDGGAGTDEIRNGYIEGNVGFEAEVFTGTVSGGDNALIKGGAGNDNIISRGSSVTIDGGDGNDVIRNGFYRQFDYNYYDVYERERYLMKANGGDNAYVSGGAGDDTISNSGANVLFVYSGGNDSIAGFNATSTLQIASGNLDSLIQISGSDLVLSVGQDSISLAGASQLSTLNIVDANGNKLDYKISSDIIGTDGNDKINNKNDNALVLGNAGNDSIVNSGKNVSIFGCDGANTINNSGDNSTIEGGTGKDYIENSGKNVVINAQDGNDTIYNNIENVTINGNAGNDRITTYYSNVIIDGGADNDTITCGGSYSSINGGDGNDRINLETSNKTVSGGAGDDTITLSSTATNNLIVYNGGNDSIKGFNETSTLQIGDGNDSYSMIKSGKDMLVTAGDGTITLKGAASLSALNIVGNGGWKNITVNSSTSYTSIKGSPDGSNITNRGSYNTISGGAGNDIITNNAYASKVLTDGGDDTISNSSYKSTIDSGDGNDLIWNGGQNVSINAGDGNNTISNSGDNSTINSGDGNDTISNSADNSTITGGAGNDSIVLSGLSHLIQYNAGDGFDTITGFNESDTLTITGGLYSTSENGNDVIVTVGENAIVLVGAKGKTLNINKTDKAKLLTLTEGADSLNNTIEALTINALGENDTVRNFAAQVTINGGNGNDTVTNYGSNVMISGGDGADKITDEIGGNVTIDGGAGNDKITGGSVVYGGEGNDNIIGYSGSIIDGGDGKDTITTRSSNISIDGGAGNDQITNSGSQVMIDAGAGNDSIINSAASVSINADAGYDYIYNSAQEVTISSGANDDLISLSSDAKKNLIQYAQGDGNDTIWGFNETSTLNISGDSYSTTKNGWDVVVNVGDDKITLIDALLLSKVKISGEKLNNSWTLNGTTATYNESDKTLVTVKGVKSLDGLALENKVVTVSKAALNGTNITVSDGYTLALGSDVTKSSTDKAWSLKKTTATYKQTTTAGYTLDDNTIKYSKKSTSTLVTVKGVKSLNGLAIKDKVVTVSKAALGTSKVTVSDGYTLALGSDVTKSSTDKAWSLKKTTATYKQTTTAGYTLDDNTIKYSKKSTSTLVTVKGVKSLNGLALKDKVVTVSKAALGTSKVTVSDGYTLALGSDVTKSSTDKAWSLKKTTATYKQTTTAGYTLDDNTIKYSKKSTSTLVTVKGVKSLNGLALKDKVVTVSKAALGTSKVTVSDGYTLALGSDVTKPSTDKAWSLKKTTATYKQTTTAGYTLDDNTIKYSKKSTSTLATVKGAKSKSGLSVKGNVIKLKNSALKSKVTISGDYEFDFASDYKNATITGSKASDTITARGKNIFVNGGKDDDTIKILGTGTVTGDNGADIFYLKPSTANIITDYAEEDKISIASGTAKVKIDDNDVVFNGKLTVQGGANKTVTYIENDVEKTYTNSLDDVIFNNSGTEVTLTSKFVKDEFKIADYAEYKDYVVKIDASVVDSDLRIIANKKNNQILGGKSDNTIDGGAGADTIKGGVGNDSIIGGKGNDSLNGGIGDDSLWGGVGTDTLFGGDGSDTFIYKSGDGKVIIEDYDELDIIRVLSGNVGNPDSQDGDVTFKVDSGQIIVKGGADKYIPIYYGSKGENVPVKYNPK